MSVFKYIPFTDLGENSEASSVICLGNFDGVHIGHAKLVYETIKMSKRLNDKATRACALCFSPFPADYFSKVPVRHIMSLEDKLDTFREMGLDGAYVCDFAKIYDYSPERFMEDILIDSCKCIGAVCGFNYRFGYKAGGTPKDLHNKFANFKMVDPVMLKWETVSSTLIKEKIEKGDLVGAGEMLGRPFYITHTVVHGHNIGHKLGFPTVNYIFESNDLIPAFGIYATVTEVDGERYISVTNVGTRPTVSNSETVTCETHIIDCPSNIDLYGRCVKVSFFKKIRDEKKFSSLEELSGAIALDVENTKKFFALK